jgi:ribosomal protein S18 acetylase RimI-like enzyme
VTTIRKALMGDAPAMALVMIDTWFASHASRVSAEVLRRRQIEWGYPESERGWKRAIRKADESPGLVLVAEDSQQIVGIAASEPTAADSVDLRALYFGVNHQRVGIGRALLYAVIDHFRGLGFPELSIAVLATNHQARGFYERMGGQLSGCREHEDRLEVIFRWDLKPS